MPTFETFCEDLLSNFDLFREVCTVIAAGGNSEHLADLARSLGYDVDSEAFRQTAFLDLHTDPYSGEIFETVAIPSLSKCAG